MYACLHNLVAKRRVKLQRSKVMTAIAMGQNETKQIHNAMDNSSSRYTNKHEEAVENQLV